MLRDESKNARMENAEKKIERVEMKTEASFIDAGGAKADAFLGVSLSPRIHILECVGRANID